MRASEDGYVYVLEFQDGMVKIGCTSHFKDRLAWHSALTGKPVHQWVSAKHTNPGRTERDLLDWARNHGCVVDHTREFFRNLSFEDVVAQAESMPLIPAWEH
jgi:hypothetical protein